MADLFGKFSRHIAALAAQNKPSPGSDLKSENMISEHQAPRRSESKVVRKRWPCLNVLAIRASTRIRPSGSLEHRPMPLRRDAFLSPLASERKPRADLRGAGSGRTEGLALAGGHLAEATGDPLR